MTPKTLIQTALAATALSAAAPAIAQGKPDGKPECRLRIDTNATRWVIRGYDPFSGSAPIGTFELIFINDGGRACQVHPTFVLDSESFGLRSTGGGASIPYELLDQNSGRDVTPVGGRTIRTGGRRPIVITPRGQQIVSFQMSVPVESIKGDGLFTQNVQVEAENFDGEAIAGRQLVLGIDVQPAALMGLSGAFRRSNGQALVDLGELQEGPSRLPLQLHVRSTRGYKLSVESLNRGLLKLEGTNWSVPYQIAINGTRIPLRGGGAYASSTAAGMRRESLPLTFHIGNTADRRAGSYSDTLTISISVI